MMGSRQPNATKTYPFTAPKFYKPDAPQQPSGLLGPVQIVRTAGEKSREGAYSWSRPASGGGGWQDLDGVKPSFCALRPVSDGKCCAAETVAVPTFGVEVHFGRDVGVLEGKEIHSRVFDVHRIVLGLDDKRGWSLIGHVNLRVGREILL